MIKLGALCARDQSRSLYVSAQQTVEGTKHQQAIAMQGSKAASHCPATRILAEKRSCASTTELLALLRGEYAETGQQVRM